MSRAFPSLITQMQPFAEQVFSSCLTDPTVAATSQLVLGSAAVPKSGVTYTPVLNNSADPYQNFY
eukprot:jgi/Mesen1/1076/ME000123S00251